MSKRETKLRAERAKEALIFLREDGQPFVVTRSHMTGIWTVTHCPETSHVWWPVIGAGSTRNHALIDAAKTRGWVPNKLRYNAATKGYDKA
jgi:hypothetical protein